MRARLAATLAVLLTGAPAAGQPVEPPAGPVTLEIEPVFGEELFFPGDVVTFRVTLEHRGAAPFRGELELRPALGGVARWGGPGGHVLAVVLPPRSRRVATVPVPLEPEAYAVEARLRTDGALVAEAVARGSGPRGARRGVVLLPESPARLAALRAIETGVAYDRGPPPPGGVASPVTGPLAIGAIPLDPTSGDPLAPETAVGWAAADVVLAEASSWLRLPAAARAAALAWTAAGGHLALIASGPDLARVGVAEVVAGATPAPHGAQRPVGFGAVHVLDPAGLDVVAAPDGAPEDAPAGDAAPPALRALLESTAPPPPGPAGVPAAGPLLAPLGRASAGPFAFSMPDEHDVALAGLDPNRAYQASLALVAAVLLVYLVALPTVGVRLPVRRQRRPLRVLVIAPALAVTCTLALLALGTVGKGARSRQLRFEIVELASGATVGPARRYTGFFPARPQRFDLAPEPGVAARLVGTTSPATALARVRHGGPAPRLEGVRAGFWETRFLREDRARALAGSVTLEADGGRVVAVRNGLDAPLEHAVVVQPSGWVVPVGRVPPGGRAAVDAAPRFRAGQYVYDPNDPRRARFARLLGLADDARPLAAALFQLHPERDRLVRAGEAALYARLPPDDGPRPLAGDAFPLDRDVRLLRVSLAAGGAPAWPTPAAALGPSAASAPEVLP